MGGSDEMLGFTKIIELLPYMIFFLTQQMNFCSKKSYERMWFLCWRKLCNFQPEREDTWTCDYAVLTEGIAGPWPWVMDCSFCSSLLCVPALVPWIQCRQPWAACEEGWHGRILNGWPASPWWLSCSRADLDEPVVSFTRTSKGRQKKYTGKCESD